MLCNSSMALHWTWAIPLSRELWPESCSDLFRLSISTRITGSSIAILYLVTVYSGKKIELRQLPLDDLFYCILFSSIAGSISYFLCFMNSWISFWIITTAFVHGWLVVPPLHWQYPHGDMLILGFIVIWTRPLGRVCVCVSTFSKEVKLVRCHPFTFCCYSFEFFTIHCRISINSFWWCLNFKKSRGQWPIHESIANEATHELGGYHGWSSWRTCRESHCDKTMLWLPALVFLF